MKHIITNQKHRVGAWVAERMGKCSSWGDFEAVGIEENGKLIGGVVINGYQRGIRCSIHCSGDGKRWINREFIRVVFDYVFRQLDCQCVVNPVDVSNADSIRFTKHIGFREVARIPEAELVIFSMPRAYCRWLAVK